MRSSFTPSRAGMVFDAVLALALFGLALATLESDRLFGAGPYTRSHDGWQVLLVGAQTLPLALRRVWPTPVLMVVALAFGVDRALDYPASQAALGLPVTFHAVGSELAPRRAVLIGAPVAALLVLFTFAGAVNYDSVGFTDVAFMALLTALPLGLGREVNVRRRRTEGLERRAEELKRLHHEQSLEAVRDERSRIARELHDVVAHEMTVMTVQAAAARRLLDSNPDQAREALTAVETAGHDALDEMRRMLGVLRTRGDKDRTTPQPGLDRLPELAEQMEEAGLHVDIGVEGPQRDVPAGVDLNAFRIIQESLTNSLKHGGPGARAWVRLVWSDDLTIEVTDDGRGGAGVFSDNGSGHGLLGMRERVALLHGEMRAGPRPGGGYRVSVRIPLAPA